MLRFYSPTDRRDVAPHDNGVGADASHLRALILRHGFPLDDGIDAMDHYEWYQHNLSDFGRQRLTVPSGEIGKMLVRSVDIKGIRLHLAASSLSTAIERMPEASLGRTIGLLEVNFESSGSPDTFLSVTHRIHEDNRASMTGDLRFGARGTTTTDASVATVATELDLGDSIPFEQRAATEYRVEFQDLPSTVGQVSAYLNLLITPQA